VPPHAERVVLLAFPVAEWLAASWRRLARRRSLLVAGCAGLAVEHGERILSACRDCDGGYALVATDRALYRRAEPGCWSRLGWERVIRVAWDGEPGEPGRFVITVLSGAGPARLVGPAAERGGMPELAAERMTHACLGRWPVPLGDGQHILVEARRRPGTGRLLWVILPNGTGRDHGDGRECGREVELAIARLAAEFGVIYRPRSGGTAGEAE
jgi:hypothetical protein